MASALGRWWLFGCSRIRSMCSVLSPRTSVGRGTDFMAWGDQICIPPRPSGHETSPDEGPRRPPPSGSGQTRRYSLGAAMTPRRVDVTRPDKPLWPALGMTKQAYVDYLSAVSQHMLPWLRDRPLSLIRAPDGVDGQRYFQKNTPSYAPSWIKTVTIPAPSAGRDVAYTVCNDADTLAWLGNQAALEFHPAPVRRDRLDRPDLLVVDIDPPDDTFDAAVEVAFLVIEVLDDLGLETLLKTTGGKGLHVVVPIVRHVSADRLRHAATRLAEIE